MKNLALVFCSIRPHQLSEKVKDQREIEYFNCIKQIQRILPKSFNMVICENTIDHPQEIKNEEIRSYCSEFEIISLGSADNIGKKNKGCGELLMLHKSLQEIDLNDYQHQTGSVLLLSNEDVKKLFKSFMFIGEPNILEYRS